MLKVVEEVPPDCSVPAAQCLMLSSMLQFAVGFVIYTKA
jgi:hypothetical protein